MSKIGQIGISAVNVALKSKNIYFSALVYLFDVSFD